MYILSKDEMELWSFLRLRITFTIWSFVLLFVETFCLVNNILACGFFCLNVEPYYIRSVQHLNLPGGISHFVSAVLGSGETAFGWGAVIRRRSILNIWHLREVGLIRSNTCTALQQFFWFLPYGSAVAAKYVCSSSETLKRWSANEHSFRAFKEFSNKVSNQAKINTCPATVLCAPQ